MRKVAVFWTEDKYYNHGDDYERIISSVTDWEEITDEDFAILQRAGFKKGFTVIEQPIKPKIFIEQTIQDFLAEEHESMLKEAAAKKKRAEAAVKKRLEKDLKDKQSKIELFNKLKKELGQ
jgi:hypothetical protein